MLDLDLLTEEYAVCRLPVGTPIPPSLFQEPNGGVLSVTRTRDEVSIICRTDQVPLDATVETPWRCFRVAGPVDLALTGILASIVAPLAEARVNIFAFSTFDTDYLLVPSVRLTEAVSALTTAGHRVNA